MAYLYLPRLFQFYADLAEDHFRSVVEKKPPPPFETPIRYLDGEAIFVIRRNDNFLNSIIVGCYLRQDEVDKLAYLAVVHIVQDKVIQIKIRADLGILPPDSRRPRS